MTYAMWAQPWTGKNIALIQIILSGYYGQVLCTLHLVLGLTILANTTSVLTLLLSSFSQILNEVKCFQHGQDTTESKLISWHIFLILKSPEIPCIFTPTSPYLHHFHLETIPCQVCVVMSVEVTQRQSLTGWQHWRSSTDDGDLKWSLGYQDLLEIVKLYLNPECDKEAIENVIIFMLMLLTNKTKNFHTTNKAKLRCERSFQPKKKIFAGSSNWCFFRLIANDRLII